MNFKKVVTAERLDCTVFHVGDLYYIHWRDWSLSPCKAIYLCDDIDSEGNQMLFKVMIVMKGETPRTLRIGNEDLSNIIDIQSVTPETEYDTFNRRWSIKMEVTDGT